MAKITRSVLKEIVKECLVEILSEGISGASEQLNEGKKRSKRKPSNNPSRVKPEAFVNRNKMLQDRTSNALNEINSMVEDPMMRDIFADTAATTLQEQLNGEGKGKVYQPGDGAAKMVHENKLDDLFEGAHNWAALAFNDGKK